MKVENLCMGCMTDKGNARTCPICGWEEGTPPQSPVQLSPRTFLNDHYLLGRVLGQGGFGITYLAWDMKLDRKVAIKEYFPGTLASRAIGDPTVIVYEGKARDNYHYGLEKFLEEGKTLAKFQDHPGVVSLLNFLEANNTGYLVMEFVEGITFGEYIDQEGGKISFETAVKILMPVMDALREVHRSGLLHRDISPDNIYITEKGQVKLLDFGAARYKMKDHNKSLTVLLKHGYAPKEQYASKGNQGTWTDVYALGATLYKAITGETPTHAFDRAEKDELKSPAARGVKISKTDDLILMNAMTTRYEDRIRTVKHFQNMLLRRTGTSSLPSGRETKKRKNVFVFSALSIVIVGILLFFLFSMIGTTSKIEIVPLFRMEYETLEVNQVKTMLGTWNFFESQWNPAGDFSNKYQLKTINGNQVIVDNASHLMWHPSGSADYFDFQSVGQWLGKFNQKVYAGFNDWRLPTLEEAASLLENSRKNGELYLNNLFSNKQNWIWTGDSFGRDSIWVVGFFSGTLDKVFMTNTCYVKPVRIAKK